MTNIFFTSDSHYSHANIIKYCNRPYNDSQHMDEMMILNWNAVVNQDDIVYHLGDFAFNHVDQTTYLKRLNGKKILIRGNHDKNISDLWDSVFDYYELYIEKKLIVLCHYPFESWNGQVKNSYHLHGHCHGKLPIDNTKLRLDVGADSHEYKPIPYSKIQKIMSTKKINNI